MVDSLTGYQVQLSTVSYVNLCVR